VYDIFEEVDADHNGLIDCTEFLRAAISRAKILTNKNLKATLRRGISLLMMMCVLQT